MSDRQKAPLENVVKLLTTARQEIEQLHAAGRDASAATISVTLSLAAVQAVLEVK